MDDDKKQTIRPRIIIEEGEKMPSLDSLSTSNDNLAFESESKNEESGSDTNRSSLEENFEEVTPKLEQPDTTILQEETKDMPSTDIKIVEPPHSLEKKKSNVLTIVLIAIVVLLIAGLLGGGIYVYMKGTNKEGEIIDSTLPSPTPLSTDTDVVSTPVPTPAEKIDISKLKVNILNGSGKIGEAGKVKSLVEKEGFKVASTGNAATFDFTETIIQTKEGTAQVVIDQLKDSLSDSYTVKIGDSLKTTSTYDIVITVGSK
jgi:hypothetical protein